MLQSIIGLIVDTAAGVLAGVLLLRFWMQAIHVRPPSSAAQFIFQLSNWLVQPLRRVMPGWGGYDWASLTGAFLVILLSVAIEGLLMLNFSIPILLALALLRLLQWIIIGFMALLFIEAVLSWVNPAAPLAPYVRAMNDPLLRPLRRIIPLVGGVDLSLLVALILLQIARQLLLSAFAMFL